MPQKRARIATKGLSPQKARSSAGGSHRPAGHSFRSSPEQAVRSEPWKAVRPAAVARGKKLVEEDGYPSPAKLRAVAELLSRHWRRVGKRPSSR